MKSQRISLDIISTLPHHTIETILCLVPIQEAARTSVLSKEWRYKWTKIPNVVFNGDTFGVSTHATQHPILNQTVEKRLSKSKEMSKTSKIFYAMFQVLLQHQGPIHEFTLCMDDADDRCVEMDRILFPLSRSKNSLKKFTFNMRDWDMYTVPLSLFSMNQLTHMHLQNCGLDHRTTSSGFGNLTSLHMEDVNANTKEILHLISKSPFLKNFTLIMSGNMTVPFGYSSDCTIFDLFEFLPMIEGLTLSMFSIQDYSEYEIPRELPVSLVHLKYFTLSGVCFYNDAMLSYLALFIRSSPNLEKITLQMLTEYYKYLPYDLDGPITLEYYKDLWLDSLNELEIINFYNTEPDLEFVKLILAKSPVLKKVSISLDNDVSIYEEVEMLRLLLRTPRASPVVDIYVDRPPRDSVEF